MMDAETTTKSWQTTLLGRLSTTLKGNDLPTMPHSLCQNLMIARATNKKSRLDNEPAGILPFTGNQAEASDEDPEMNGELASNDELNTGRESFKFEIEFQRLKEYKEVYGTVALLPAHCHDGRFNGLNSFLNYWRSTFKCYELGQAKKSTKAEANIRHLIDLGVDMDTPTTSRLVPSPAFERNCQLLKEYNEVYGTVDVLAKHCNKGQFQGLGRFLIEWRSKARHFDQPDSSKAKKILQLIDLGVDMGTRLPFAKNFKRLKEYKEVYGTVAVLAEHCRDGKFMGLNLFLNEWRRAVTRVKEGRRKKTSANEGKIRQFIDLGVDEDLIF
jgi:hypothetical protein